MGWSFRPIQNDHKHGPCAVQAEPSYVSIIRFVFFPFPVQIYEWWLDMYLNSGLEAAQ